jgi:hypothetical protein
VLPYYVEQHYDYPRFLCYDCHAYSSYHYWNPYAYSCFRFRIVVYDDYYYYPYRRYGGVRMIYRSAPQLAPHYVFKDRGTPTEPFITRVRERPVDAAGRRVLDAGVTAREIGGRGRVPTPVSGVRQPSHGMVGGERRGVLDQTQSSVGQADIRTQSGLADRRRQPRRVGEAADGQSQQNQNLNQGGRRTDGTLTRDDGRQQPTLERRDPRRVIRRGEAEMGGQSQPSTASPDQPRNEPTREPPRRVVPDRQPDRQSPEPDRRVQENPEPRAEPRRAEPREQPRVEQPRAQRSPEARAEPRYEPRAEPRSAPEEKPRDSNGGRRRSN